MCGTKVAAIQGWGKGGSMSPMAPNGSRAMSATSDYPLWSANVAEAAAGQPCRRRRFLARNGHSVTFTACLLLGEEQT